MFEESKKELLKFYYFWDFIKIHFLCDSLSGWDFIKIHFLCDSLSGLDGFNFSKKVYLVSNLDYDI